MKTLHPIKHLYNFEDLVLWLPPFQSTTFINIPHSYPCHSLYLIQPASEFWCWALSSSSCCKRCAKSRVRCCCWLSSSVKFLLIRREACAKELTKSPRAITPAQLDFKRFQQLATQKWKIYKNLMSICQETVCAVPCLRAIWPSSLRRDRNLNLERNQCSLRTFAMAAHKSAYTLHTPVI